MDLRMILGLVGSLVLVAGVFAPIFSFGRLASVTYLGHSTLDGTVVLIIAASSIILSLAKKYKLLLTSGIAALIAVAVPFLLMQARFYQMRSEIEKDLEGNPFAGLASGFANAIQIEWGWAVLLIGSLILIAAALLKTRESELLENARSSDFIFSGLDKVNGLSNQTVHKGFAGLGVIWLLFHIYFFFFSSANSLGNPTKPNDFGFNSPIATPSQSKASGTSGTESSTMTFEEMAYLSKVSVSNVQVAETIMGGLGIFGELKNNGDKVLSKVEIKVEFLDSAGKVVMEETFLPVLTSSWRDNSPLKPNFGRKFGGYDTDDAPSDWAKKVNVSVSQVKFDTP